MILEIALGIVLAVLILAFLPQIVAAGIVLLVVGVLAAAVIAVLLYASGSPQFAIGWIILVFVMPAILRIGVRLRPKIDQLAEKLPPRIRRWVLWRSDREARTILGNDDLPPRTSDQNH